jgi:L-aminopeptidase/D-esterase-like protein
VSGLKGGLGSASLIEQPFTIGALFAVNALGSVTTGNTRHFWASPFERDGELGAMGWPEQMPADAADIRLKFADRVSPVSATTIGVIATDARLDKAQAKRLAIAAHDGIARAVWPAHSPMDGDLVFALATGTSGKTPSELEFARLCAHAGSVTARAIARGVYCASAAQNDLFPTWSQKFA